MTSRPVLSIESRFASSIPDRVALPVREVNNLKTSVIGTMDGFLRFVTVDGSSHVIWLSVDRIRWVNKMRA